MAQTAAPSLVESIEDRARDMLAEHLGAEPERVTDDAQLVSLGADSLDYVEIAIAIEDEFNVEVPDDLIVNWITVGEVIALILRLIDAKATGSAQP